MDTAGLGEDPDCLPRWETVREFRRWLWPMISPENRECFDLACAFEAREWMRHNWSELTLEEQDLVAVADAWYEAEEGKKLIAFMLQCDNKVPRDHYFWQVAQHHGFQPGEKNL